MLKHVVCCFLSLSSSSALLLSLLKGLELLYDNDSMFLVLASSKERNELYEAVVSIQPTAEQQDGHLLELTHQWQTGTISNYDYLMKLNL